LKRCTNCGSETTRMNGQGYPDWRIINNGYWCKNCWQRTYNHIYNRTKRNKESYKKTMHFKDKRIRNLRDIPRIGQCQRCGKKIGEGIKRTNLHHILYHDDDPLKDTIELCVRCHTNITLLEKKLERLYSNLSITI
jgi:hypothetical protein